MCEDALNAVWEAGGGAKDVLLLLLLLLTHTQCSLKAIVGN